MNQAKARIALFSSQPLFCTGITLSLVKYDTIRVLMACPFSPAALDSLVQLLPDVIIVDIDDDVEKAIKLIESIHHRITGPGIIIMSGNGTDISRIAEMPDTVYYPKTVTADDLYAAIMTIKNPEYPIEPLEKSNRVTIVSSKEGMVITTSDREQCREILTNREREVLSYVALGYLNKQIAHTLGISTETIKNHITSALRKLRASSRTDAVVLAIKQGLITIS